MMDERFTSRFYLYFMARAHGSGEIDVFLFRLCFGLHGPGWKTDKEIPIIYFIFVFDIRYSIRYSESWSCVCWPSKRRALGKLSYHAHGVSCFYVHTAFFSMLDMPARSSSVYLCTLHAQSESESESKPAKIERAKSF